MIDLAEARVRKQKEEAAAEAECRYYIRLYEDNLLVIQLDDERILVLAGDDWRELIVTKDYELIDVTANSYEAIIKEAERGKKATGYIGVVDAMWFADKHKQII